MRAGRLRWKVVIQQKLVSGQSSSGEPVFTWSDVATVWAEIAPETGREVVASERETATVHTVITIRYRHGITAAMRVKQDTRLWNIQAVLDPTQRHRELQLVCIEQPAVVGS